MTYLINKIRIYIEQL
jgi:hypothetical protein